MQAITIVLYALTLFGAIRSGSRIDTETGRERMVDCFLLVLSVAANTFMLWELVKYY
jgi:hypothetical protein